MIALVPLHVARQCGDPINSAKRRSASVTSLSRDHRPARSTGRIACSSASSHRGQLGNGVARSGAPPRIAGTPAVPVATVGAFWAWPATAVPAATLVARNCLRVSFVASTIPLLRLRRRQRLAGAPAGTRRAMRSGWFNAR